MEPVRLRIVVAVAVLALVLVAVVHAALQRPAVRQAVRSALERVGLMATYQEGPVYRARIDAQRTANATLPEGCVVLLGDSLIEGFEASQTAARGWVNRGISGDRVRHVDARLGVSVLEAPCADVALLVGINDVQHEHAAPAEVGRDIEDLVRRIEESGRRVFLHTLPAPEPPHEGLAGPVNQLNGLLRASPEIARRAVLVDLQEILASLPRRTRDGIHLTPEAYEAWTGALAKTLRSD